MLPEGCDRWTGSYMDNTCKSPIMAIKVKYVVLCTLILQNNDFKDMTGTLACFDHNIAVGL